MDPNANLAEQEAIIIRTTHYVPGTNRVDRTFKPSREDRFRLQDLQQALYDWIRDGGFEPDWSLAPNARKYYGR